MKRDIPFLDEFRIPMAIGIKTATARNKNYGNPGDTFDKWDMTFELVSITKLPLGMVSGGYYRQEGFNHPTEFIKIWDRLHPRKRYDADQLVWFHEFKRVDNETEKGN